MRGAFQLTPANRWLESLLALVIAGGVAYALWHLFTYAYLPQPFFYEPFDLWADWFNTAYWAYDPGTYDNWHTLYPPISFVFLKLFTRDHCYPVIAASSTEFFGILDPSPGLPARSCDWLGLSTMFAIYFLNCILVARIYWKRDQATAVWRSLGLMLGWPMLNALERGNLFLITFTCMILAYGPLLKSARLRWIAAGMAVNFKVYLIASIFPLLLKRRWRWVEGALLATILVYLVTFAILGRGTPMEIYANISNWASGKPIQFLDLWMATTYKPMEDLLQSDQAFPVILLIGSRNVELLTVLLPLTRYAVAAMIFLASVMVWLRSEVVPIYRVINFGVMLAIITTETGGYTEGFFIFFVFLERWRGFGVKWAIIACYILSIPADIPLDQTLPVVRDTYLWGTTAIVTYYVMLGPFIRPLIILTIPFALSLTTIRAVWIDMRKHGWFERRRLWTGMPSIPRRPPPVPAE